MYFMINTRLFTMNCKVERDKFPMNRFMYNSKPQISYKQIQATGLVTTSYLAIASSFMELSPAIIIAPIINRKYLY